MTSFAFQRVLPLADIPENSGVAVSAFGRSILICRGSGAALHALANECSHQGQPLAGGRIRGHLLFCPFHGACYDMRTGIPQGPLTKKPIRTYAVRAADGWVELSEAPAVMDPDRRPRP